MKHIHNKYFGSSSDLPLGCVIAYFAFILFIAVGWIVNIVKIVGAIDQGITAMFLLRVVGIFVAPLGAILGFI